MVSFAERITVLLGRSESIAIKGADAHPRLRESGHGLVAPARLFDVLTQGELDTTRGRLEFQRLGAGSLAQFDHAVLAADGVG